MTDTDTTPSPIYFDCDTGIDDAMALALLLASSRVDLVGIGTVSGNVSSARAARNTLDLLALACRGDVPVAVGAAAPLGGSFHGGVPHIHGSNGLGDVQLEPSTAEPTTESAAELLVQLARTHPGRLRIIAVGPLTNLALALRMAPDLPSLVRDVTLMGGAAMVPGNVSPVAEANIGNDPEAAADVVAAPWPVTMVPLDVTLRSQLEESDREQFLDSGRAFPEAIGHILDLYFEFNSGIYGRRACALHDPLAVAVALGDISLLRAPRISVQIDTTDGPGRGQTIWDLRGWLKGYPDETGAHTRIVLAIGESFGPMLRDKILTL